VYLFKQIFKLIRPHQWVKNGFVLMGVFFGHDWSDETRLALAGMAAAAFSLVSSGTYIINDLRDAPQDRLHPVKKHRPIASGAIAPVPAALLSALLLGFGFGLAFLVSATAAALIGLYLAMNLAYSYGLKHVVILDVFVIAIGFMLRILVGTVGIGIDPSQWLLFCGLMLTLFLGFAKRRAELAIQAAGGGSRRVLEHYSPQILDVMIAVTVGGTILSYSLYTMNERTVAVHGTEDLIYTAPFVIYGIFRYVYLLYKEGGGEDTARDLIRDPHILLTVFLWGATTLWLIGGKYLRGALGF